ncbi:MAG TPA: hypothetical protein VFZ61_18515 [Polyangiales bacterium]
MSSLATPAIRSERTRALTLWLLPLALLGALIASLLLREQMQPAGSGSAEELARIARNLRGEEAHLRREALKKFPGDPWSQGDDFSARERDFVNREAQELGIRHGAVLDAIDRDVRAFPGHERGSVPPCMPRPFYQ